MSIITEHFHEQRLKKLDINIKTKFQDGKNIYERNSDNSYNDDIKRGIILNKTYYKSGKPVYIEKDFNPSMLYSFVINSELEKDIECANCGAISHGKDFLNGCPYCGSVYIVEYLDKNTAAKFNKDYVVKDNKYKISTICVEFIACLIISSLYCVSTGRTFTIFDVLKILGLAIIGTLLLFYPIYLLESSIIKSRAIVDKEKKYQRQLYFWNRISKFGISKEKFFNNLNNELNEFFYDDTVEDNVNVIDYDVVDYDDYKYYLDKSKRVNINVKMEVRVFELVDETVCTKNKILNLTLVQNEIIPDEYHPGIYVVRCHGCGASIDIMKNKCEYCGAKVNYLQSWYISNIEVGIS